MPDRIEFTNKVKESVRAKCAMHCCFCSKFVGPIHEFHHIIPYSVSKDSFEYNCILLCRNCHAIVGPFTDKNFNMHTSSVVKPDEVDIQKILESNASGIDYRVDYITFEEK